MDEEKKEPIPGGEEEEKKEPNPGGEEEEKKEPIPDIEEEEKKEPIPGEDIVNTIRAEVEKKYAAAVGNLKNEIAARDEIIKSLIAGDGAAEKPQSPAEKINEKNSRWKKW